MTSELFHGVRVVFKNKNALLIKLSNWKLSNISVISDFDYTMTKFKINGERGASCHKVIEDCGLLSDDYQEKAKGLQAKYYPLEVDPSLDLSTKTKYMVEWVTLAHTLLEQSGLTLATVKKAVFEAFTSSRIKPRQGVPEFVNYLETKQIPFLIFSAGIKEILEEVLSLSSIAKYPSMYVISNSCHFNGPNQSLSSFDEPVIHVFNKKSSSYLHTEFFQRKDIHERTNVLLIGDSLGDITMCEGMHFNADTIVKVGFLNDKVEERLVEYLEVYDIVILDDPGFDVPLGIIKSISE